MQSPSKTLGAILSSRKVWIALAAVAGCVVTVVGADPAKWTPLIASIVTLASVVVAAISYEDAADKGNPAIYGDDLPGGNPVPNAPPAPDAAPQGEIVHSYRSAPARTVSAAQAKAAASNLLLIGISLAAILASAGGCAPAAPAPTLATPPALTPPVTQPAPAPAPAPALPAPVIALPTIGQLETQVSNLQAFVTESSYVLSVVGPFFPQYYPSALAAEKLASDGLAGVLAALKSAGPSDIPLILAQIQTVEADVAAFRSHPGTVAAKAAATIVPATQPAN